MIRWLLNLIIGKPPVAPCSRECQWEIFAQADTMEKRMSTGDVRTVATVYTLRCKTCGDLKDHRSGL